MHSLIDQKESWQINMDTKKKPLAFISYIHEDKDFAFSLRDWISENLLSGLDLFLAGDEVCIPLGTEWPRRISYALHNCAIALLVLSPKSSNRKWIYFEAGAVFSRNVPVIPICCKGMTKDQLTPPLSLLQAIELPDNKGERFLLDQLAKMCGLSAPQAPRRFLLVAIQEVQKFVRCLEGKDKYTNWRFRINWPMAEGTIRIDAYSDEIDWRQLLDALSMHSVASHEVASIFEALQRTVMSNAHPPRKLSGTILFREASKYTLEAAQNCLGSKMYERVADAQSNRDKGLSEPAGIFLPNEYLVEPQNLKNYSLSQKRIAQVASLVCKYAVCSTYQISISQAIHLTSPSGKSSLAMACTATNTNKENLSIVAEIPVLISSEGGDLVWYGQLHKPPTSEYESHWAYHCQAFEESCKRTLIVHFHPIGLLERFEKLKAIHSGAIPSQTWRSEEEVAWRHCTALTLKIFDRYEEIGARDAAFGQFMANAAVKSKSESATLVVWKPNHGVWILSNGEATDEYLQDSILKLERFACFD